MKKYSLVLIPIIFFALSSVANAATVFQQLNDDAAHNGPWLSRLGNVTSSVTATAIHLFNTQSGGTTGPIGGISGIYACPDVACAGGSTLLATYNTSTLQLGESVITLSSPVTFDGTSIYGTDYYALYFDTGSGPADCSVSPSPAYQGAGGACFLTFKLEGTTSAPAISMSFPQDGTSTQNFQNWVVHVSDLQSSTIQSNSSYSLGVWYSRSSSTLQNLNPGQGNAFSQIYLDLSGIYFNDYNSPKTQCLNGGTNNNSCFLFDGGDNFFYSFAKFIRLGEGNWFVIPYVAYSPVVSENSSSVTFGIQKILAQGSLVQFNVSSTAPLPAVSTSTNLAAGVPISNTSQSALSSGFGRTVQTPVFTPATTTISFVGCLFSGVSSTFNIWNGSDWQCLLLNTTDLFKDSASNMASAGFNDGVSAISSVFPLSVVADFNNDISLARSKVASTSLTAITLGNGNINIFRGHTFTLFDSSTMSYVQDHTGYDLRGFISKLIYAILGGAILAICIAAIRKMHNQTP